MIALAQQACMDPTVPVCLDPTFPARFVPCTPVMCITTTIMTACSTSSLSVSSSSPSVSASSSTDVLPTTSAVSFSIQTPNRLHSTSLKTYFAQNLSRLLPVNCTLTWFDNLRNQAKQMKKKNMTLLHPFQTKLNHISAEAGTCTQIWGKCTHTHKGGKILSSSNQARYLQDQSVHSRCLILSTTSTLYRNCFYMNKT